MAWPAGVGRAISAPTQVAARGTQAANADAREARRRQDVGKNLRAEALPPGHRTRRRRRCAGAPSRFTVAY